MRNIRNIILFIPILVWSIFTLPPHHVSGAVSPEKPRLGAWITVFSHEKVLYSKEKVDQLLKNCKKAGIGHIYLQIYRADKAAYDSSITDKTYYRKMLDNAGEDTIKYLLSRAKKNDIKIYAWMNLLSLAQNKNADIIRKFGKKILTKDQYGRNSLREDNENESDKYYIREDQLFLEPGDEKVREYLAKIAEEIVRKYPEFDGLHLDYIRYPTVVPFIPGSRFTSHGISYGYGKANAKNFKKATGLDVKTMKPTRENFQAWDRWRRDQVTALVRDISDRTRSISPSVEISCAIVPSLERTYLVNFQDWTRWLREGYVDWVVVMNYTDDTNLMKLNSFSLLLPQFNGKVYIGVGAFLMKDKPGLIEEQISFLRKVRPGGIVIFSYDDIMENEDLQLFLSGS